MRHSRSASLTAAAFLYGILNLFFGAFPFIYQHLRMWPQGNAGLPFIGLLIGFVLSVPVTLLSGRPYINAIKRDGKAPPELRLVFAMIAAVLVGLKESSRSSRQLPICLFWMGWTGSADISWAAPVVAGGIFGFSQIGLTVSSLTFLADCYGYTVGSAIAALK